MAKNKRIKIAGYAKRIFFNDNIEYRNFSPDLVGFQLTSEGGTTLFTNGNFSISVNLDPKPNVLFTQGTKSKFFTLDDIVSENSPQLEIQKNLKTKLNLDLTNPISYVWYGSSKELIRSSLIEIQNNYKHLFQNRSFIRRIKRMILRRIVIFRILFYSSAILIVGTFLEANKMQNS
jgi:hypothetical protein